MIFSRDIILEANGNASSIVEVSRSLPETTAIKIENRTPRD